ncbi:uncharacterized protein Ecym_4086 [Eremothecium cymbalariae DBVPG|uniref:Uncharacterized protein n=1 Tax=Eremothecium cymbalariae (strain CBS 270.75 / DBVPG 7215 / KCTC 17166 / NRRL Y-17582) TaxID=931890 RepID=G8JT12_ERECY|nr:hypothetical protein Ecym_4086 [Eremothecium cymbalariae DBVPG\
MAVNSLEVARRRWTLGLFILGLVVFLWVLSAILLSHIFEDGTYRKPFFVTYLNTASFVIYLLPRGWKMVMGYLFMGVATRGEGGGGAGFLDEPLLEEGHSGEEVVAAFEQTSSLSLLSFPSVAEPVPLEVDLQAASAPTQELSVRETVKLSADFCIMWVLANVAANAALSYTSVTSQIILSSTSSFFTLIIGACYRIVSINKAYVLGCVVSFIGIILTTYSDSAVTSLKELLIDFTLRAASFTDLNLRTSGTPSTFFGNLLALLGSIMYGFYCTLLKYKVQDESQLDMMLFFGFVGLFTLLFFWPLLIIVHLLGLEAFELPHDPKVISVIFLNCFIMVVSELCWAKSMFLTSPLTVTVGLSATIPFAMFGDYIIKGRNMTLLYFIGASLIFVSIFIINKESKEVINRQERPQII